MLKQIFHSTTEQDNRNAGIDMLRGFSILSVILLHCLIHMPLKTQFLPTTLNNIIFRSGYYGVITFFVISGFLITHICLKRWGNLENINIGQFYRIRFARIMPCLILLLIVSSILDLLHVNGFVIHTTSLSEVIFSALTFHINYLRVKTGFLPGGLDVLWTLSIEEVFYVFFPIICLFVRNRLHFTLLMFTFIVIAPFSNMWTNNPMWSEYYYFSNFDGIAVGCLCALISNRFQFNSKKLRLILFSGVLLSSLILFFRHFVYEMSLTKIGVNTTILEIGIGFMLIAMQQRNAIGTFWTAPLRWFGRNSYEVYLTHGFFIVLFSLSLFNKAESDMYVLLLYALTVILSGVMGQLISSYFSEPMNRFLRKNKVNANGNAVLSDREAQASTNSIISS
ncbi:MAG: acyltransferase [Coxiellaceae bacterium]|nr:acyltransferase [Coxiellaceae bacterium]